VNANELADELEDCGKFFEDRLYTKAAAMLRQQQAEIEALKDFAIWMTGCGYDFCQHDYFNKCRDELLIGLRNEQ
jgi:hypothetical protein